MTSTPDIGWYRDPDHPDRHRFWDGQRWQSQTSHLRAVRLVAAAETLIPTQTRGTAPDAAPPATPAATPTVTPEAEPAIS